MTETTDIQKDATYSILAVEDDKFLSRALNDKLEREGFDVRVAGNGIEALKMIEERTPDLMLLDIMMPKKNGFEVLEEIRLKPDTRNIPVAVLTNLSQESDRKKCEELGVDAYFVKSDTPIKDIADHVKHMLVKNKE
jgi:CheY-like chemotaxis protein